MYQYKPQGDNNSLKANKANPERMPVAIDEAQVAVIPKEEYDQLMQGQPILLNFLYDSSLKEFELRFRRHKPLNDGLFFVDSGEF